MAFCNKCGNRLVEGATFCTRCGTAISSRQDAPPTITPSPVKTERTMVYDGEIHKCPNCGELLNAFDAICSACGYELRDAIGARSIENLSMRLERATSEQQRIAIVKSCSVPNTKADLFEFMILAVSNFDAAYYNAHLNEDDISDAWLAKIEQCYQKARLLLEKDDFAKIEALYLETRNKIRTTPARVQPERHVEQTLQHNVNERVYRQESAPAPSQQIYRQQSTPEPAQTYQQEKVYEEKKTGFSTWNPIGKLLWIILNLYLCGTPAILYLCFKKR